MWFDVVPRTDTKETHLLKRDWTASSIYDNCVGSIIHINWEEPISAFNEHKNIHSENE